MWTSAAANEQVSFSQVLGQVLGNLVSGFLLLVAYLILQARSGPMLLSSPIAQFNSAGSAV